MALSDLLVDTGCIVAAANRRDAWFEPCAALLRSHVGRLLVPALVIAEATYLLRSRMSAKAEESFVDSLANGDLTVVAPEDADWPRVADLVRRYPTLGTVDASVVATAERLGVTQIATIDRRDFGMVRPLHVDAFTLLPHS